MDFPQIIDLSKLYITQTVILQPFYCFNMQTTFVNSENLIKK